MIPITSAETTKLSKELASFGLETTLADIAGLLTIPAFHANTIRFELLAHLAVAHCSGNQSAKSGDLLDWINKGLEAFAHLEDPVEDVFVTNIETPDGNKRIFSGIWESNDFFLQCAIDVLLDPACPEECRRCLRAPIALLRVSDFVAERLGLQRWHSEESLPSGDIDLTQLLIDKHGRAVTFTGTELEEIGVTRESLAPFIFDAASRDNLATEIVGHSSLERRPLIDSGDSLVMALPHAISPAIRRFLISELRASGHLRAFEEAIAVRQTTQVTDALQELRQALTSLSPDPRNRVSMPAMSAWLFRHDTDKYLHVVLLQDRLDELEGGGLTSAMRYESATSSAFVQYLIKTASDCRALPGIRDGATVIILGGLGRGFMLGFREWPQQWRMSVMRVSDFMILSFDATQALDRFLKCMKHRRWVVDQGVSYLNLNGDFNFYSYWQQQKCQLVMRQMPVSQGTMMMIQNDFVLPVRQALRMTADRHRLQLPSGAFVSVIRMGRECFFESMSRKPIYVSVDHLNTKVLAGALETQRGSTWLLSSSIECTEEQRRIHYELWNGVMGLFDKIVTEIETQIPVPLKGPVELRLNFDQLDISRAATAADTFTGIPECDVRILEDHVAEIRLPTDFLVHFQQPDNRGETLLIRAISSGLIRLHGCDEKDLERFTERVISSVLASVGTRFLHLFHADHPVEVLIASQRRRPRFLSHEDFVFSKLKLTEGCTPLAPPSLIRNRAESNAFLNRVVDRVWNQIRELLRTFDRASLIRKALMIHEFVIQDRDEWNRTANAIISIYSTSDDVYSVAQKREQERSLAALAARTILEMAICECPITGGFEPSDWELDALLAKAALLVEVASDSDAIRNDLSKPEIEIHQNGEYTADRSFHETVIRPFMSGHFQDSYRASADGYSRLYRRKEPSEPDTIEALPRIFIDAFSSEFGLTPDEAATGFSELMDFAVELDMVVVITTRDRLTRQLISRGLSQAACKAFLESFGLYSRPAWNIPPAGFIGKDIEPWKLGRRLSLNIRPVLIFGDHDSDHVLYGAATARQAIDYLFYRVSTGHFAQGFFKTDEMKRYISGIDNERGREFTLFVAEAYRVRGWNTRSEIQMTELGANASHGDVDVLAWKPTGEVMIIECKRLRLAKTIGEIAAICRRFHGEAKDELQRHLTRVSWLKQNPSKLAQVVGLYPTTWAIDDRLVTNTRVPMTYLSTLPIRADKIGPLSQIDW